MYESIGGAPPALTLGIGASDPASSVFTATTIPGVRDGRPAERARGLRAVGGPPEHRALGGTYYLDEDTKQYRLGPAFRREAQNVGGIYAQDQWRVSPRLTFNYGLRWELSGAATNPNEVYSSPTLARSVRPVDGAVSAGRAERRRQPRRSCCARSPYKRDFNNPAPNVGVAWNPDKPGGLARQRCSGDGVYRANFGVNYYDEGLINFQTAAGNGPGLEPDAGAPARRHARTR